jgi:hypothetical protein
MSCSERDRVKEGELKKRRNELMNAAMGHTALNNVNTFAGSRLFFTHSADHCRCHND